MLAYKLLGGNKLTRTKLRPFSHLFFEAQTANNVPFHFDLVISVADVDIDRGLIGLKGRSLSQMGLLMLRLDGVIRHTAINILTVNANAHG